MCLGREGKLSLVNSLLGLSKLGNFLRQPYPLVQYGATSMMKLIARQQDQVLARAY